MVVVPTAHDLVGAAAIHAARQTARLLGPMPKEHGIWRKCLVVVVDIAVQRLVHCDEELCHAAGTRWNWRARLDSNQRPTA